jgi:hypothetical protein
MRDKMLQELRFPLRLRHSLEHLTPPRYRK